MYFSCSLLLVLCCVSTFMFREVRSQYCTMVTKTRTQTRAQSYSENCGGFWNRRRSCTRYRMVYEAVTYEEEECSNVPAEYYTDWFDHDDPSGRVDTERIEEHRWRYGDYDVCRGVDEVVSAECRVKNTAGPLYPNIVPHITLRDPWMCSTSGLFCWNDPKNICLDYEVRYKCRQRIYTTKWYDHPSATLAGQLDNPRWNPDLASSPDVCPGNDHVINVECRLGSDSSAAPCGNTNIQCWAFPCTAYQVRYTCIRI